MFDNIINKILSIPGVTFLTYAILFVAAILYSRAVTGANIIREIRQLPVLAGTGLALTNSKPTPAIRPKLNGLLGQPETENIPMDGGSSKGTVTEILAKEVELKLAQGETVQEDFIQSVSRTSEMPIHANQFDGFSLGDGYSAEE